MRTLIHIIGCCISGLLLFSTNAFATPTVSGNTITWPDDGYYQVQSEDDYSTVCEGVRSCEVDDGVYLVVNHTTGERFPGIVVSGGGGGQQPGGITVNENVISWPNDGWYQVQSAATFENICEGGTSCEVTAGTYIVINHSTGIREEIVVGDGGGDTGGGGGVNNITVTGNTISWPNDGWYQVQSADTYASVCEGGTSCEVSDGSYIVINHTTGVREEVVVGGGDSGPGPVTEVTVTGNTISWPNDGWYQVQTLPDYRTVCEGGSSCVVDAGNYVVINHSSGVRTEVTVGAGPDINRPPSVPTGLLANAVSWSTVLLTWNASIDPDGDPVTYQILRNGQNIARTNEALFTDNGLVENTNYEYEVAALDNKELASGYTAVSIRTPERPSQCSPTITGFALFDAGSDQKVRSLNVGGSDSIDADDFPQGFSIIAEANECTESVLFTSSGNYEQEQSDPPYAIANDRGNDIFAWESWQPGNNTVRATPYAEDELLGAAGGTATIQLNIQESVDKDTVAYTVPALPVGQNVAIDGDIDSDWPFDGNENREFLRYTVVNNTGQPDPDVSGGGDFGFWQAMYDENYLYISVGVRDTNTNSDSNDIFRDDALNIFIDGDNSKGTSYDGRDDFHIMMRFRCENNGYCSGNQNSSDSAFRYGSNSRSGLEFDFATGEEFMTGGHAYEIRIKRSSAGLTHMDNFGLEIQVDEDLNGGDRDYRWAWFDSSGQDLAWRQPRRFGNVVFSSAQTCMQARGPGSTTYLSATYSPGSRNTVLAPKTQDPCIDHTYYLQIDPANQKDTLEKWQRFHGYDNGDVLSADYVNAYDLGFGRKMRCRDTGNAPCVVQNFDVSTNPGDSNPPLIASVAMERNNGRTDFYVFNAAGLRVNSINLDGSGDKSVPEVCFACHFGGSYLAFDVELFEQFPGGPALNSQNGRFAGLNRMIERVAGQTTHPRNGVEAMAQKLAESPANKRVHSSWNYQPFPGSQGTQQYAITNLYAKYCRSCHVAQPDGSSYAELTSPNNFNCQLCHISSPGSRDTAPVLRKALCETDFNASFMPNSRITHQKILEDAGIDLLDDMFSTDGINSDTLCREWSPYPAYGEGRGIPGYSAFR